MEINHEKIIRLIAEEIMEFKPPTEEITDPIEYSSELRGYVNLSDREVVYNSIDFNRSFYWRDKDDKPIRIDDKLQYKELKFNPIYNLGHIMILLNKIRFDYKYEVKIYSDEEGFEITISDPKILNGKCYEFEDEVISLTKSSELGEALCTAALEMKNIPY